jgi:hypothetical protein
MINVHDRVNKLAGAIEKDWTAVDFGCGDQWLAELHHNTINVDCVNNSGVDYCVNLDVERPDVCGDCAVCSGLLEWLQDPLALLDWLFLNGRFPRVYFSFALMKADPRWIYACTIEQIIILLMKIGCQVNIVPWQGQVLCYATKL